MKNLFAFTISVMVALLMLSCGDKSVVATDTHGQEEAKLILDNGNKWKANAETTEGVLKMKTLLSSFTDRENPKAYLTLKQNLENELNIIFSKCTMKGEAHDQLHNFLIPIKDMIKGLDAAELSSRQETVKKLESHLALYENYFE